MSPKAHGQVRRGQVITTWGPGSLLDLPHYSVIVGGLDQWPNTDTLDPVPEPRLSRMLGNLTGVSTPRLFAPPVDSDDPQAKTTGIGVWRFPEWFVVQELAVTEERQRSRRMVHRKALTKGKFDGRPVVPTRFTRACPRGHIDDLDWRFYVHGPGDSCKRQLWLDERGASGDLGELRVRCDCKKSRSMVEATEIDAIPLGMCTGKRPWLGLFSEEECDLPSRLLIRTASNAYFPQVVSVLSIPDKDTPIQAAVAELWSDLQIVDDQAGLDFMKKKSTVAERLAPWGDDEVLAAIFEYRSGPSEEKPVKQVELDALLSAAPGYGEDVPIDPDFHARRLPEKVWRKTDTVDRIDSVVQVHRLREVMALAGFTRFEAVTPDIDGEYDTDVERAALALEPSWFPAVENRGEGLFIRLRPDAVQEWLGVQEVKTRLDHLRAGHERWAGRFQNPSKQRVFPGGPYILLHTLSHLLVGSLAMRCGYPASSIRERIYVDLDGGRYGILLYTGSPDAEGTLGGLVQQSRYIDAHMQYALASSELCSNDPICSQHDPGESLEERWLHGAACHGCTFIAETSCEMRNDYLDRALVVPVLGMTGAAFFS